MLLIAGLGNPGSSYQFNRHNIGFMAVDVIGKYYRFPQWKSKFQALITEGIIGQHKILLIKPQTYMNLSGQSLAAILRFYKLPLECLSVIHDELDLPPAKVRLKIGGGSGGHNGIKSIDAHCGKNYRRLRLGIGHPGYPDLVHNWVLSNFGQTDQLWLAPLLDNLAKNITLLLEGKESSFMNKLTLEQLPKSVKRFSDKSCDKTKG